MPEVPEVPAALPPAEPDFEQPTKPAHNNIAQRANFFMTVTFRLVKPATGSCLRHNPDGFRPNMMILESRCLFPQQDFFLRGESALAPRWGFCEPAAVHQTVPHLTNCLLRRPVSDLPVPRSKEFNRLVAACKMGGKETISLAGYPNLSIFCRRRE